MRMRHADRAHALREDAAGPVHDQSPAGVRSLVEGKDQTHIKYDAPWRASA
jgi:hypothetical protein